MSAVHLNKTNFEKSVENGTSLVDFWASWCAPCKAVAPTIDALADKLVGNVLVGKVNIEEESDLADRFNIMGVPTVILFKNGKEVKRLTGAKSLGEYEEAIKGVPNNKA